jgi:hypothetical protein
MDKLLNSLPRCIAKIIYRCDCGEKFDELYDYSKHLIEVHDCKPNDA